MDNDAQDKMRQHAQLDIAFRFSGPDVDEGVMSIEDIVPVLQGFAGAYSKAAAAHGLTIQHKLRLTGIKSGSAILMLDVWETLGQAAAQLPMASKVVGSALAIVTSIVTVIRLKKHAKNKPYTTRISGTTGDVTVINAENVSIVADVKDFGLFKEKSIDTDLSRIVRPLDEGKINNYELTATDGDTRVTESISADERGLFDVTYVSVMRTQEAWLIGQINAMVKSSNTGHIILTDGGRVHFTLKTDHPERYYEFFGHRGLVKVLAIAHLDENLHPVELEISQIIPLQGELGL